MLTIGGSDKIVRLSLRAENHRIYLMAEEGGVSTALIAFDIAKHEAYGMSGTSERYGFDIDGDGFIKIE